MSQIDYTLLDRFSNRFDIHAPRAYNRWKQMKQRCSNPNCKAYGHYGGRGITVCERWLTFRNFLEDMGEPPANLSLDRTDNDGNYCPENCRWVSWKDQCRNQRRNRNLTCNGKTMCITDWASELGCTTQAILGRIKRGYSIEDALTIPIKK